LPLKGGNIRYGFDRVILWELVKQPGEPEPYIPDDRHCPKPHDVGVVVLDAPSKEEEDSN
jgi:hypothetical protein